MIKNTPDNDFEINCGNGTGYIVNIKYAKHLHKSYNDLPFLPDRMNSDKCNKFLCNLHKKNIYCVDKNFEAGIESWFSTAKSG